MTQLISIFIIYSTFTTGILADSPKTQPEAEYERKILSTPLTRDNYRSVLKLGEVQQTVELQYHGRTYISEETTLRDGDFIIDDEGNVISGDFMDEYVLPDGSKIGALYYIFRDANGDYIQKVTDDHHEREHNELLCDEIDDIDCPDEIDTSWWTQILQTRRRNLQRQQTIEFSIKWFYTPKAATKLGGLAQLEAAVLLAMGEANQAFENSGLPVKAFIAGDLEETGEITDDNWETEFIAKLSPADRNKGDVISVIQGEESSLCGLSKTVPEMFPGETWGASGAFFKIQFDCLNAYIPIHEIGHLMGLGHNAYTTHCPPPHTSCGNIITCGDYYNGGNGRRTIMSYTSLEMWNMNAVLNGFKCSREQAGTEKKTGYFSGPNVNYILNGISMKTGSWVADSVSGIKKAMTHIPGYAAQDQMSGDIMDNAHNVEYGKDAFVFTGDCGKHANCLSSKNYPSNYGSNNVCSATMTKDVEVIPSKKFSIEAGYDFLSIGDGGRVHHIDQLEDIPKTLSEGATLYWTSDDSHQEAGWQLCFNNPNEFFSMTGDCDAHDNCVSSGNYPGLHGNNEECTITMLQTANVTPSSTFSLETCCDHLMIGGVDVESSGAVPKALKSGDVFTWSSDHSVTKEGWQLCFTSDSEPESAVSLAAQNERLKAVNKALSKALQALVD